MCGISGIFDLRAARSIAPIRLQRMSAALIHRGPDGEGAMIEPGIALGHRRLAIIDPSGGQQPLSDESGSVTVVFNGEIYNFQELMAELEARGHRFRTRCDTEVIVHAWRAWGEACLERFRGMFAFALWDRAERRLFLARDRLGEKPLYYTLTGDGLLLFASELRALLAGMTQTPDIDPLAVEDYFALGYVPDPKTIHAGIHKLPPAHCLSLRSGQAMPAPRAYWDLRFGAARRETGDTEALRAHLDAAVRSCLVSDVPLGAFLSGGVDSSGIVALMARALDRPVQTCSIGFAAPEADESRYAAMVAARYGTDHFTRRVEVDACALIDRIAQAYSEPFADSSALPTYLVSRLARERVTVALSGDGADEVFAGYRRYAYHLHEERLKARLPAPVRQAVFGPLAAAYPKLDWAPRWLRAKATFEALGQDAVGGYFRAVTYCPDVVRFGLYSGDLHRRLGGYRAIEVLRAHAAAAGTEEPLARAQYIDLKTWLPGAMLTKVDRASMANSLEVRAPFLDHRLVEWAAGLAVADKVVGVSGKVLLKKALEPLLPREVLYRPKQGFSLPLAAWLRGDLAERLEELARPSAPLLGTGLFAPAGLRRLIDEHRSGRRDHARPLWALLMFDAFLRRPWQAAEKPAAFALMPG